jgi:hypothetical protein
MQPFLTCDSQAILVEDKSFQAAKCDQCGAKMYPQSLLQPHLTRHQRRQRLLTRELRKLRHTFTHMRDIA